MTVDGSPALGETDKHGILGALRLLLRASTHARADDLPRLTSQAAVLLGARNAVLYVVDYDQVQLVPLLDAQPVAEHLTLLTRGPLPVEGTMAGRCFSEVAVQATTGVADGEGGWTLWAPVLDGTDRLGVLEILFDEPVDLADGHGEDVTLLAGMIAELIMSRKAIGDSIERARRRLPMQLEAELQWNLLPPLTFAAPEVSIAGVLMPTTEVAGDSFDYAVNGDIAHLTIVDAMGHGLDATLMSAVAIGALRNARRSGLDLIDTVRSMNKHVAAQFGDSKFVTAIVGELDTRKGVWSWVNAGHPAALVVRGGRVVRVLDSLINPPLGLQQEPPAVGDERLERGDRLVLYTDGVIEARDETGEFFGTQRLVDFICRESASGRPAAEALRRLNLAIMAHQDGLLQDDATTLMVEWSGEDARRTG
jgi:serine phosphatase RsbU (regulator of sigma subunit)